MRCRILSVLLLIIPFFALGAEEPLGESPPAWDAPESYGSLLGLTLREAFDRFGVPEEVSAVRGDDAWQDDVVFRYENGLSLFWYRGRVWQVRFDRAFLGSFLGLAVGANREHAVLVLGEPFYAEGDWTLYQFAGRGFPIRLRLFFGDEGLEDAYLYRGDF